LFIELMANSKKVLRLLKIIEGRYNQAVVFTDKVEGKAAEQILELCNQEFVSGSRIRIMSDSLHLLEVVQTNPVRHSRYCPNKGAEWRLKWVKAFRHQMLKRFCIRKEPTYIISRNAALCRKTAGFYI